MKARQRFMSPQWLYFQSVHSLHKKENLTKTFAIYVLFISFKILNGEKCIKLDDALVSENLHWQPSHCYCYCYCCFFLTRAGHSVSVPNILVHRSREFTLISVLFVSLFYFIHQCIHVSIHPSSDHSIMHSIIHLFTRSFVCSFNFHLFLLSFCLFFFLLFFPSFFIR